VPKGADQIEAAEQASDYILKEFERLNGFQLLYDAMHDAVVKGTGFIKTWWEDEDKVETQEMDNLTDEELAWLGTLPGVEIVEIETTEEEIEGFVVNRHKVTAEKTTTTGCLKMEVLPPEDFFIDESATCKEDALVYGHQCDMRVADLVGMGIDFETAYGLGRIGNDDTGEKYERANYTENDEITNDPAMKLVTVTECYMRVDIEGDGDAQLYKFLCGGQGYKVLDKEKFTGSNIAVFESDPVPHLFFGGNIPSLLFNDQDASTAMFRGVLDNIALTNSPRTEVNDEMVNIDDLLNNEVGGVVRVEEMGQINPLVVPFIAGTTLPAIQYYDQQIEAKTGVNQLSAGLSPDALQNQTATATNAMTQAGANQMEAIARHLAEGGMCDLFRMLLELVVENVDEEALTYQSGQEFVQLDPRAWNIDFDMRVNVGLGTGREAQKQMALTQLVGIQKEAIAAQMPGMTVDNIRNTVADSLAISGVRNIDRYWPKAPEMPPQQEAPPEQDPMLIAALAEKMKAEADLVEAQTKQAEAKAGAEAKAKELQVKGFEAETKRYEADIKKAEAMANIQKSGADAKKAGADAMKALAEAEAQDINNLATETGIAQLQELG